MQINNLMVPSGGSIYYDADLRNVLEDHMTYLREHSSTVSIVVESDVAYRHEFDLFSTLRAYRVREFLHWVTMRMNNMTAPRDPKGDLSEWSVPDQTVVGRIAQSHRTTRKIS